MSPNNKTIDGIQYLRWWAAAIVVVYHAFRLKDIPGAADPNSFKLLMAGNLGVQIFFVISGFIITVICLDGQESPKISWKAFAQKRLIRIVPIMWVATALYFTMKLAGTGQFDWPTTWRAFVLWPVGRMEFGVLWTLRLEVFFYFLFALVMLVERRLWPVLVLWFLSPIIVRLIGTAPFVSPGTDDDVAWIYLMGHQVGANLQFGLGFLLGLLWNRRHPLVTSSIGGGAWLVGAAALGAVLLHETVPLLMRQQLPGIIVSSAICMLVVWVAIIVGAGAGYAGRLSRVLGDASYSIYLFHVPVQLGVAFVFKRLDVPGTTWFLCMAAALLSVLVAVALHFAIEKPLIGQINGWKRRRPLSPRTS